MAGALLIYPPYLCLRTESKEQPHDVAAIKKSHSSEEEPDPLIESNHLLTLLITKRKVCLFEATSGGGGADAVERARQHFAAGHIPSARLLLLSSVAHNGVPVHPLQFQRYARSLGVDADCRVVLYDRGERLFATYAFWIFKASTSSTTARTREEKFFQNHISFSISERYSFTVHFLKPKVFRVRQ